MAKTWPFKRYKEYERELRNAASSWFEKKDFTVHPKMSYCLKAHQNWPLNIICKDVVDYIKSEQEKYIGEETFPLHKYLHHGLSSQAMIFNLVGPLVVRNDLEPLQATLAEAGIPWPDSPIKTRFEYEDRDVFNENFGQPTSIDLVISGKNLKLYVEAKLVEREFGGCSVFASGDCEGRNPCSSNFKDCYLHYIGRQYWQLMQKHGFLCQELQKGPICPLANYYQFFREVVFAIHKLGKFILLYDERNPVFLRSANGGINKRGLWPFLIRFVPEHYRMDIGLITIQQVVQKIEASGRHEKWVGDFKIKYGIN